MEAWGLTVFGASIALAALIVATASYLSTNRRTYVQFLEARIHQLEAQAIVKDLRIDELVRQQGSLMSQIINGSTIYKKPTPEGEAT